MAEDYEEILRANLRKLEELGVKPEEMTITDRIFERLAEQELALHRLTNLCKDMVSSRELGEVRAGLQERIDKLEGANWARISELRQLIESLSSKLKDLASKSELDQVMNSIQSLRSEMTSKIEQVKSEFNAVTKRLSEVDAEIISDMGKLDRISERLEVQELELKKLSELSEGFVTQKSLEEIRSQISREDIAPLKSLLDASRSQINESLSKLESMLKDNLAKLSQVDAGMMERISKLEHQTIKLNEHDVAIRKLGEIYEGFLDRKTLDAFKEEILNQYLKPLRSDLESKIGSIYSDLSKKLESLEKSISELSGKLLQLPQIDVLRSEIQSRIQEFERGIKEGIKTLAEVDSRIIEDLGAIRSQIQRLPEFELKLKRLSEIYEGFTTKRDLAQLRSELESKLAGIPSELPSKLAGMESRLEELWDILRMRTPSELESKISELEDLARRLKRDFDAGVISKEVYETSNKRVSEQMNQFKLKLEHLRKLEEMMELVRKHQDQLAKLIPLE